MRKTRVRPPFPILLCPGLFFFFLLSFQNSFAFSADTLSPVRIVGSIRISGNRVTKERIIRRELNFHEGDTLQKSELAKKTARARENLLNTSLFNFVTISDSLLADSLTTVIRIDVKERWYTWPIPVFEIAEQNINTWWSNGHNLDRASYGMLVTRYNFRGRKETLAVSARLGYSERLGISYTLPFIDRKQRLGAGFSVFYARTHELAYLTQYNFLKFCKSNDRYMREENGARFTLSYRPSLYFAGFFEMRYLNTLINDTIRALQPDYFPEQRTRLDYFTVSARFLIDHRDLKVYPQKGWYADAEFVQLGLGLLPAEKINCTNFYASLRKYGRFGKRFSWAGQVRGRFSPGRNQPYYLQRALGFNNYVRGYEYYVVDGQSFALGKTQLRYEIIKPQVRHIKFLPLEKFNTFHLALYGGIFADAGYTDDRFGKAYMHNNLSNALLFGTGAGLDFVTYYDIVLRAEFSVNRLGETGFFLHLGAPL